MGLGEWELWVHRLLDDGFGSGLSLFYGPFFVGWDGVLSCFSNDDSCPKNGMQK